MKKSKLEKLLGKKVTLLGTARDAKGGAVLVTAQGEPIYIKNLDFWPQEIEGKQVSATGVLKDEKFIPDPIIDKNGGISTGATGTQYVLEKAKYSLK